MCPCIASLHQSFSHSAALLSVYFPKYTADKEEDGAIVDSGHGYESTESLHLCVCAFVWVEFAQNCVPSRASCLTITNRGRVFSCSRQRDIRLPSRSDVLFWLVLKREHLFGRVLTAAVFSDSRYTQPSRPKLGFFFLLLFLKFGSAGVLPCSSKSPRKEWEGRGKARRSGREEWAWTECNEPRREDRWCGDLAHTKGRRPHTHAVSHL